MLVVALVILGPSRLPDAARSMGKAVAEFRKVTSGLQAEVRDTFADFTGPLVGGIEPPAEAQRDQSDGASFGVPTATSQREPSVGDIIPPESTDVALPTHAGRLSDTGPEPDSISFL